MNTALELLLSIFFNVIVCALITGRLEVQVLIPRPDQSGRREIFKIHFEALRRRGRLSEPLCRAIDGLQEHDPSENIFKRISYRSKIYSVLRSTRTQIIRDLASDSITGGFSGADCSGLVRCAGSIALARARSQGMGGIETLIITLDDVAQALKEVKA